MAKKRDNTKGRRVVKSLINNADTRKIKLEFGTSEYGTTDASNLLVLPSKKRKTKIIRDKKQKTKFLSKEKRKRLEKIVEKKQKKENRAGLLEALSRVQASSDEIKQLGSISAVQTMGKRKLRELGIESIMNRTLQDSQSKPSAPKRISSIAGANKRKRLLNYEPPVDKKVRKRDPNVVGSEEDSCYASTSEEEEGESKGDDQSCVVVEEAQDTQEKEKESNKKMEESLLVNDSCQPKTVSTAHNFDKTKKPIKKEDEDSVKNVRETLPIPAKHVEVKRDPKIQVARLQLPILGEEQKIMELINDNEILLVAGETGSGKTTQIPQFLYEAGYAAEKMIAVTEPRRVATVAMSKRVGYELGLTEKEVSYLMRFEGNVTKDTKIKFMTDGVLLKEMQSNLLLSKYSVVILDEAHERSVYTDILLGMLSRIVRARRKKGDPLRLIIMSATLRVEDFTENSRLFKIPPQVINIDSRQFPVTVHFNKHTFKDYVKEAFKKTIKIHTRLPEGGVLIFVTGQQEVNYLVRKLRRAFPYRKDVDYSELVDENKPTDDVDAALDSEPDNIESDDDEVEREMKRALKACRRKKTKKITLPKINLEDYDMPEDDGLADILDYDSDGRLSDSDQEDDALTPVIQSCRQPLWVLPLYSMLSSSKQAEVFQPPPVGTRLCVVSTDVAETSLTIPNIKYVVDTGKKKMRLYDHATGATSWRVVWTSQASAEQRSGRAGRTGAGHAYRLYSSAVFQHNCPKHHPPELCRRPPDDIVLLFKCMGIDKVVNFPFPTAPDRMQLRLAERRLEILEILEKHTKRSRKHVDEDEIYKVTPLGTAVASFPILPRYGKMLALSHQKNLLPYTIAMVATLSVSEVLTGKPACWPAIGEMLLLGDPGVLLRAVGAMEVAYAKGEDVETFCAKYGLREKAMREIRKLRKQLTSEIMLSVDGVDIVLDLEMKPPDDIQAKLLRQLLLCGLGDQVARKIGLAEVKQGEDKRKFKYAYRCSELEEPVHLHSDSILRSAIPEWVVYQDMYETGSEEKRKMVIRNVVAIEPEWLPLYVQKLCNLSEPLSEPEPRYDERSGRVKCHVTGTFGKQCWELPTVEIDYPDVVNRYRWFARFILDGSVFPKLRKFTGNLLTSPSTMIKPWANLHPRTDNFLKALLAKRISTRDQLTNVWKQESSYMLNEYLKWMPQSKINEVTLCWPPL